ncbi:MAG: Ycf66 family protein [Synechococcaceae cyanobacterium]|nr:Ycf66 family protein [Synechococcaceae cyanobacterium]
MLATLGGSLALLLGIAVLLLPLLAPELSRPRDAVWGALVLLLGLVLVTSAERLTGSPMLAVLCGGLLIGRLGSEVGRGRWNQLTDEERGALATPQRWAAGLAQLGASLAVLLSAAREVSTALLGRLGQRRSGGVGKRWVRPEGSPQPEPPSSGAGGSPAEPAVPPLTTPGPTRPDPEGSSDAAAERTAAATPAQSPLQGNPELPDSPAEAVAAAPLQAAAITAAQEPSAHPEVPEAQAPAERPSAAEPPPATAIPAAPGPSADPQGHEEPEPVAHPAAAERPEAAAVLADQAASPHPEDIEGPQSLEQPAAAESPQPLQQAEEPVQPEVSGMGPTQQDDRTALAAPEPPAVLPGPAAAEGGLPWSEADADNPGSIEEVDAEVLDPPPPQRVVPDFGAIDALLEASGALPPEVQVDAEPAEADAGSPIPAVTTPPSPLQPD